MYQYTDNQNLYTTTTYANQNLSDKSMSKSWQQAMLQLKADYAAFENSNQATASMIKAVIIVAVVVVIATIIKKKM